MSDNLDKICDVRFAKSLEKPVKFTGIIQKVDLGKKYFSVKSLKNKCLKCYTEIDIDKLNINDKITVIGWLKIDYTKGKIYVSTQSFYTTTFQENFIQLSDTYNKLYKLLAKPNCQDMINKFKNTCPPQYVSNIGLIVYPGSEKQVENFKLAFAEMCVGKLFICKLNESPNSLIYSLEYFKKYHDIDVVCLLFNDLSYESTYNLSSKENIKYMINRKDYPYVVSIVPSNIVNTILNPLLVPLSNLVVNGINNFIWFVHQNQSKVVNKLNNGLKITIDLHNLILEKYKTRLNNARLMLTKLTVKQPLVKGESLDKLKVALLQRICNEKIKIHQLMSYIAEDLICDTRIYKYVNMYSGIEKKNKTQNLHNTNIIPETNDANDTALLPIEKKIENYSPNSKDLLNISIQRYNGNQ